MDFKNMSLEELNKIMEEIKNEISIRTTEKVIYITDFERSNSGYKRWAKVIANVDTGKNNGYAFLGTWLKNDDKFENIVDKDSYILEYIGYKENQYSLYKALDNNKKELVLNGDNAAIISFIQSVAQIINK